MGIYFSLEYPSNTAEKRTQMYTVATYRALRFVRRTITCCSTGVLTDVQMISYFRRIRGKIVLHKLRIPTLIYNPSLQAGDKHH